jgi:hypothetical protein
LESLKSDKGNKPTPSNYPKESPEDSDEHIRNAFFSHSNHFFILTIAGKPVFTRYLYEI